MCVSVLVCVERKGCRGTKGQSIQQSNVKRGKDKATDVTYARNNDEKVCCKEMSVG